MMAAALNGADNDGNDSVDSLDRMVLGQMNGSSSSSAPGGSKSRTSTTTPASPSLTVGTATDLSSDFGPDEADDYHHQEQHLASPRSERNKLTSKAGGGSSSSRRAFAGLRDSLSVRTMKKREKMKNGRGGATAAAAAAEAVDEGGTANGIGIGAADAGEKQGVTFVDVAGAVEAVGDGDGKNMNKKNKKKKKKKKGGVGSGGGGGGSGGIANPFRKRYDKLGDPSATGDAGATQYEPPPTFDLSSSPRPPPPPDPAAPPRSPLRVADVEGSGESGRGGEVEGRGRGRQSRRGGSQRARSRSRSLLRGMRLPTGRSSRGGSMMMRNGRGNASGNDDHDDDDDDNSTASDSLEALAEEDPLIDLFETHNTKRVVFDPTFVPGPAESSSSSGRGGALSSSGSSFNIKGFMNRIIHKDGKEKEAEVAEISSAIGGDSDDFPMVDTPSPVPSPSARPRAGSALRSGRSSRAGPSSQSQSQRQLLLSSSSSGQTKTTKFDPYIIDKAKSRSTTTAAVAAAAITRSGSSTVVKQLGNGGTAGTYAPASASNTDAIFQEDPAVTKRIERLLGRANRAHTRTYRYEHAIGYYLAALDILNKEGYPEEHDLVTKSVRKLNDCHHAQSSLKNSANIVKMGIKHENRGEFVRALKMYTIAYRIRRDALSKFHPSLPVLLNMLGSVQVKRGELKEAMQIYELALNGRPDDMRTVSERRKAEMIHPMTKSVTLRDMGMIYERWGDDDKALQLYEESLAYVMKSKQDVAREQEERASMNDGSSEVLDSTKRSGSSFLHRSRSHAVRAPLRAVSADPKYVSHGNEGEMEVYLESSSAELQTGNIPGSGLSYKYDAFFPPTEDEKTSRKKKVKGKKSKEDKKSGNDDHTGREGSDVNVAITLHQIAQINRRRGQHAVALSAYQVALRGMKRALGDRHPNVAAILGNLGNLHKEMGNFDEAYSIYQEVLGIETHHLGLCHPEVIKMQKSLFGPNHISVAVTSSCMGDVYERMGDTKNAMNMYEETLRIRTEIMGRQHLDVGRLLHKLGCLALQKGDYRTAEVYITKATAVYISNELEEDHPWMRDIRRNEADIKGLVATGLSDEFGEL